MNALHESSTRDRKVALDGHWFRGLAGALLIAALISGCASAPPRPIHASAPRVVSPQEVAARKEPPVETAKEARERGGKALLEHDGDLALYYYLEAVELDAQDAESFYNIGVLNQEKGNMNLAVRAYAQTIAIDPDHALALQALGIAYFEARKMDSAQTLLTHAVSVEPDLWRAHNVLGVIADTHGEYAAAAEHYRAALAASPGNASVLNNRGYSKYLAGDLAGAEQDFHAALAADASYGRAWHNLGLVLARQHNYDLAKRAMSKVTSDYVAANDVGYIAMLDGDYDAAGNLFAEAVRLSPRYYKTAQENAAELRKRRGQQTLADAGR